VSPRTSSRALDAGWSATDNLGNTWQLDKSVVNGTSDQISQLSTRVTTGGTITAVTLTPTNSVGRVAGWVDQPGVNVVTGTYVDKAPAGTTGNTATPTATATGTLAQASEYIYASVSMPLGATVSSAGGSFTLAGTNVSTNGTTDKRGAGEDLTVAATTTVTATMNLAGGANQWAMVVVTYKIAAGGTTYTGDAATTETVASTAAATRTTLGDAAAAETVAITAASTRTTLGQADQAETVAATAAASQDNPRPGRPARHSHDDRSGSPHDRRGCRCG
jgi:hypothetical protein